MEDGGWSFGFGEYISVGRPTHCMFSEVGIVTVVMMAANCRLCTATLMS